MSNKKINVIDLFCGCGGLSYGFEQAGFNILLGIDNDDASLKTFEMNHKNSKTLNADITQVSAEKVRQLTEYKKIDLIIGGPPCQGMSLSGPRKFQDPRNKLYLTFIRMVSEIKPEGFVVENVPGLVSLFHGAIKDNIINEFSKLGYRVNYQILNAAEYGVPQYRKRVVFVGLKGYEYIFPIQTHLNNQITCEDAIGDLPPLENELGSMVQEYGSVPKCDYQVEMRKNSLKIYNHIAALHTERVKEIISLVPDGGNYKTLPEPLKKTRNFHVAWTRFSKNKPAPTIDTGHRHHFHYQYNRVPTVRECARIQSFPDRFIFYGNKTQQFRQVGNAVPPILAQKIAENLLSIFSTEGKNQ